MIKNEKRQVNNCRNLIDYRIYKMSIYENMGYMVVSGAILFVIGYIFYRSFAFAIIFVPFSLYFVKLRKISLIEKRKHSLCLQFKDMLYALSASLNSGTSIEIAFKNLEKDLMIEYGNKNEMIITEVKVVKTRIEMNESIESALIDFAERSGADDIKNFTDVFCTCRKLGGNVSEIIQNSIMIINEKIEINDEINTILASKKFEQKIMLIIPLLMIIVFDYMAKDYMAPFYSSFEGRIVSTIVIVLIGISYLISRKIINIKA